MKFTVLKIILPLLVLFTAGSFLVPSIVYAQAAADTSATPGNCTYAAGITTCTKNGTQTTSDGISSTVTTPNAATGQTTTVTTSALTGQTTTATQPTNSCGIGLSFDIVGCGVNILANIAYYLMAAAGYLLGIAGEVFNWVIVITVFQFALYFANSAGMFAAWGILRDIANICILFGFIYIGITIILDINGDASRKALTRLLIFAALLNFSLFASEAVVDVANVLSATLFKQAGSATFAAPTTNSTGVIGTTNGASTASVNNVQVGIAGLIMQDTGTGTAFTPTKIPATDPLHLYAYIGTTVFILVTMAVLLAGTVIFAIRAVLLCILLVISPLGFAAMAIPRFQERGRQWWQMLIQNAFFAPMFLLLIFASLKIMEAARTSLDNSSTGGKTLADALASPGSSTGGILIVFLLVTGFMIAAFQFARSSSVIGGQFATSFAERTVRGVASAPYRMARAPVRIASREIQGNIGLKGGKAWDNMIAKGRVSKNPITKGLALTARGTGIDMAVEHSLANMKKATGGTNVSFEQNQKNIKERTAHLEHDEHQAHLRDQFKSGLKQAMATAGSNVDDLQQAMQKMEMDDLKKTLATISKDEREMAATVLSSDKLQKLEDDKEVTPQIKEDLIHGKFAKASDAWNAFNVNKNPATFKALKDVTDKYSKKDFQIMGRYSTDLLSNIGGVTNDFTNNGVRSGDGESLLSGKIIDALNDDDTIPPSIRGKAFKSKRIEQLKTAMDNNDFAMVNIQMNKLKKEAADIGDDKIYDAGQPDRLKNAAAREFVDQLNTDKLAAIISKGEMSDATKDAIMDRIQSRGPGNAQYDKVKTYLQGNAGNLWGRRFP